MDFTYDVCGSTGSNFQFYYCILYSVTSTKGGIPTTATRNLKIILIITTRGTRGFPYCILYRG